MQAPRKGVCVCVCVKRYLAHAQWELIGEERPANEEPAYSEFIYGDKPRGMSRRLLLDEFSTCESTNSTGVNLGDLNSSPQNLFDEKDVVAQIAMRYNSNFCIFLSN